MHTTLSVEYGGGDIMVLTCMASSGTRSLVFSNDVDRRNTINS